MRRWTGRIFLLVRKRDDRRVFETGARERLLRAPNVLPHQVEVLIAALRGLLERAIHNPDDARGKSRQQRPEGNRLVGENLLDDRERRVAWECLVIGQQLVEDESNGEHVAPEIDRLSPHLLG